jgi:hypothetical protein
MNERYAMTTVINAFLTDNGPEIDWSDSDNVDALVELILEKIGQDAFPGNLRFQRTTNGEIRMIGPDFEVNVSLLLKPLPAVREKFDIWVTKFLKLKAPKGWSGL